MSTLTCKSSFSLDKLITSFVLDSDLLTFMCVINDGTLHIYDAGKAVASYANRYYAHTFLSAYPCCPRWLLLIFRFSPLPFFIHFLSSIKEN